MTNREPWFKRLWARLKDKKKPPRLWWFPPQRLYRLDPKTLKDHHTKCSETIRRSMLVMLSSSFFVLLTTLTVPDRFFLIEADPNFTLQGVVLSLQGFLIAASFILIVELVYLHIFYGYWHDLEAMSSPDDERVPTLFNLNRTTARLATDVIFYWWVPLVFFAMAFKAAVRPTWSENLLLLGTVTLVALVFTRIRRCPETRRRGVWRYWAFLALLIA